MRLLSLKDGAMRWLVVVGMLAFAQLANGPGHAASCTKDDFANAVDRAGALLRKLNAESMPQLRAKMRKLKEARGWPDSTFEEQAYAALQDERIAAFDAQANDLLAKLDQLGTGVPDDEPDCAKLEELTATSLELQATVKAKTAYTLAKLDQMLAGPPAATAEAKPEPKVEAKAEPKEPKAEARKAPPPPAPPPAAAAPPPKAAQKAPPGPSWETKTTGDAQPKVAIAPPPPPSSSQTPLPPLAVSPPEEDGYTIDEIMSASAGFFGKVSAGLGSVIEQLFKNSGRPTGYVLGTEGGGAFLAGVRYGSGTLYMRSGGTRTQNIYWHGPSIGTDFGADGSKTLFLIYRMKAPEELYASFSGIDGSAYFVGGVGATLLTNGSVILAPIRSGVGLRLGANIGYIRFTPKATWNPF
ncbi:MAG TPA: DUF1134 domain-containing protein [Hyphomicrobiaceae bacterium]